jgi:hypothetical protein
MKSAAAHDLRTVRSSGGQPVDQRLRVSPSCRSTDARVVPSTPYANSVSFVPLVVTVTFPGEPLPVDQVTWGVPTDAFAALGIGLTDNTGAGPVPTLGSVSAVSARAQMYREIQLQAQTSSPRMRITDGTIHYRVVG